MKFRARVFNALAMGSLLAGICGGCIGQGLDYDRSPPNKNDLPLENGPSPTPTTVGGGTNSGGSSSDTGGQAGGTQTQPTPAPLNLMSGDVLLSDGSRVALESLRDKPLVLIFAAEFCSTCKVEHERIIASLKDPLIEPGKVKFLSVVVAMLPEDAQFWKEDRQVPWSVGSDEDLSLIDRLCGVRQTPCMVIQTPERGIVLKRKGEVPLEEMRKAIGGDWNE